MATDRGGSGATEPIERREYEAAALMRQHPPAIHYEKKQQVFWIACPPGVVHSGRLAYSRWPEMELPHFVDPAAAARLIAVRDGFFTYEPFAEPGAALEWHVNFAATELFGYYGGGSLAQDELQVLEHPALGALREALLAASLPAVTVERGRPTPVLVMGAERRCHFATEPDAAEGRPDGLYGRRFREAEPGAIRRATTVINPPTVTNVIAIAAPVGGRGSYTAEQIQLALATAYTGFRVAILESERLTGDGVRVVIHTGFWGAGAFHGNPVLLSLIQILAAQMAGVGQVVHYAGTPSRLPSLERALAIARDDLGAGPRATADLMARILAMDFQWGSSDGN